MGNQTDLERRLLAALDDSSRWVRMGAVQALSEIGGESARASLEDAWARAETGSDEQWLVALALERVSVDTLPLLAPLAGLASAADLQVIFDRAHDDWVRWARKQDAIPYVGLSVLDDIRLERVQRQLVDQASLVHPVGAAYARAVQDFALSLAVSEGLLKNWWSPALLQRHKEVLEPVLAGLSSDDKAEQTAAVHQLAIIALTEPDGYIRGETWPILADLHAPAARRTLLQALMGNPPSWPSADQLREMASHSEAVHKPDLQFIAQNSDLVGQKVAISFAYEALKEFYDNQTAWAIVDLALHGDPGTQARAEEVLADMRREASLPALFWAAANSIDWGDRRRAETMLQANVVLKERYYDLHRIAKTLTDSDLSWLLEIFERVKALPDWATEVSDAGSLAWARNRATTQMLLQYAITLITYMESGVSRLHRELSPWDRFVGFFNRILDHGAAISQSKQLADQLIEAQRYTDIDFPATCVLNEPVPLRIGLSVAPQVKTVALSDVQVVFGYQETFVDLLVLIHAPDFEVSPKWGVLKVPFTGDSSKCEFSLTPKKLGTRRIEVELLQVADRRGYTYFTTQVVEKGKQVGQATASKIESTSNRDLLRRGLTRAVIYVEWQRGAGLNYQVLNPARGSVEPEPAGLSAGNFTLEQAREWVAQQGSIIKDYLRQDYETEADLRGALSNIAAIGHGLFQQLVPKEIVQLAKDWPPGSVIAIDTNESWIPWELIHDDADGDFWGERFQIVRIPRVPPGSEEEVALIVPAPAVTPECLEIQKIVSVVGDEIMVGNEVGNYSVERTFGEASRYVTDIVQGTFDELQVALRDAEVVHFTCHGRTQPIYHLSYGPGPGRRLLIPQVDQLPIKPGAMIFANACASNQPELLLNEFQSFGWHFFVCGARPYIGTLGPVPIKHAITFAECFYKHFITEGLPAGLALRQAKRDVRKQYRNPFRLFYCLYGPASACMRLRPI